MNRHPLLGYCEKCCYKQSWASFSVTIVSVLWSNIPRSRTVWLYVISMLIFLRNDQTGFHGIGAILIFLPQRMKFPITSHIFKASFLIHSSYFSVSIWLGMKWLPVVVLMYFTLMTRSGRHSFHMFLSTWVNLPAEMPLKIPCLFSN